MLNHKPKEAVAGAFVRRLPTDVNDSASESGLAAEDTALGRRRGGIRPCGASSTSAKMIPLRRIPAGRGLGGPQKNEGGLPPRRASLAPTAFSFGGVRNGRIAPAVYLQVCGLTPCGNSSELPLPSVRSANPHGVALPLAGENDSRNLTEGGRIMAKSSPARTGNCAEPEAPSYSSAAWLDGTDAVQESALAHIVQIMASNKPEQVARAVDTEVISVMDNVTDGLQFIAATLAKPADKSENASTPSAEECRGLGSIVTLLADCLQLVSLADYQRGQAIYHLKNRG